MNSQIQLWNFTHGKCRNCGHLSMIGNFQERRENESRTEGEDGFVVEFCRLILICPLCGDEGCEGVYPNEVN